MGELDPGCSNCNASRTEEASFYYACIFHHTNSSRLPLLPLPILLIFLFLRLFDLDILWVTGSAGFLEFGVSESGCFHARACGWARGWAGGMGILVNGRRY